MVIFVVVPARPFRAQPHISFRMCLGNFPLKNLKTVFSNIFANNIFFSHFFVLWTLEVLRVLLYV